MKFSNTDKYIGVQKGVLTIAEIVKSTVNNKYTIVKCKCSKCGQYSETRLDRFTTNVPYAEHYCEHCREQYFLDKAKENFIGKENGVLQCIDVVCSEDGKRKEAVCKCSNCGNISKVRTDRLCSINYIPKSCAYCYRDLFKQITKHRYYKEYGCEGKEYESKHHDFERVSKYKTGAYQRNLEYTLTDEEAINLLHGNCYYCNQPKADGIDRVDSSKGYSTDNCVPCCSICNIMKNKFSKELFLKHVKLIYENHLKTNH